MPEASLNSTSPDRNSLRQSAQEAYAYISIPFGIVLKSCKLIPVMMGGVFILRKK